MLRAHHARALLGPLPGAERPVLYTHTCCPYAQRALMALLHKVRARTPRAWPDPLRKQGEEAGRSRCAV